MAQTKADAGGPREDPWWKVPARLASGILKDRRVLVIRPPGRVPMRIRIVVPLLATSLAVAAVTGAYAENDRRGSKHGHRAHQGVRVDLPDRLDLPDGWQPEGIAAGRGRDLYVGSIPTGAVLRLDARTGQTTPVVPAQAGRAAIGLKLDQRGRLVVAGGPTGKAFIYDARTGADVAQPQLSVPGAATFVNDVALARGTAYFTDSRRSAIYAVDTRAPGTPRTIELPAIPLEAGNNLNGIVATEDGRTLLAVQTNAGRLWRIDPAAGTAAQVDLGGPVLTNGDGLLLNGRTLHVVQNRDNQIAVVRLDADYTAGSVVTTIKSTGFDVPTTLTTLRGELYAVNARFGTTDPPSADYWVTLVRR
jgi:sugar lactone lactonase YvrE